MKNYLDALDREALRARAEQLLEYAGNAKDQASRWSNQAVSKAHTFSLLDFSIASLCLASFGAWLGASFNKIFDKLRAVLFVTFAASWFYLFWRIVFDEDDE